MFKTDKKNKHIFLFIFAFLLVVGCYNDNTSIEWAPEKARAEALQFLSRYKSRLMDAVYIIKANNGEHPISFSYLGRRGHVMNVLVDGSYEEVASSYAGATPGYDSLFKALSNIFIKDLSTTYMDSDSVIVSFLSRQFNHHLVSYICYSKCSKEELRGYTYGMEVYSKDEIPERSGSFFWEIEDNWYIYEPKRIHSEKTDTYDREWASHNKEKYYYEKRDTFNIVLEELKRLNLRNVDYDLSNMHRGLFMVEYNDNKKQYLYTQSVYLDSIFVGECPFYIHRYSGYYKFDLWKNYLLDYFYSPLPQDSLEKLLGFKIVNLEGNWYYHIED